MAPKSGENTRYSGDWREGNTPLACFTLPEARTFVRYFSVKILNIQPRIIKRTLGAAEGFQIGADGFRVCLHIVEDPCEGSYELLLVREVPIVRTVLPRVLP